MTEVDPRIILAQLGIDDATSVVQVTTGIGGTSLFRVERGAVVYALRVYQPRATEPANRELAAMAAAAAEVPVPVVHARAEWAEQPVVLLGWCPGRMMLEDLRRRPWRALAHGRLLGRTQARIHAVSIPEDDPAIRRDWLGWHGLGETPLGQRLRAIARGRALLHLDLHPLNVLVEGGRVSGVLDWENAAVGDPRADLARTWSLLRIAPEPPGLMGFLSLPVRRVLESGWRRGYAEIAGWPEDMELFNAWAVEAMANDLAPKVGRPGVWFGAAEIEEIRREAARWRARAGVE
jgi:aminoglycoside phosphotransferase (APT) family kinase protein